jgi:hypothetical protein
MVVCPERERPGLAGEEAIREHVPARQDLYLARARSLTPEFAER